MANPYPHGNHCFPFSINGVYSGGLVEAQQQQQQQQNPQQPPQYQQHQQQGQSCVFRIPNPHVHSSNVLNSPTLATLFERQNQEAEQIVRIQNDKLKLMLLQQQREQQVGVLRSLENYSQQVLITKNEEIARATSKNKELENLLNSLEAEKGELKRIVEEREVMVIALHNQMEEEKRRVRMIVENDEESCCGEIEEAKAAKCSRSEANIGCCLRCSTNSSDVLFLPCRHLSSCKTCEALLQTCPICGAEKKGVIEIQSLMSD